MRYLLLPIPIMILAKVSAQSVELQGTYSTSSEGGERITFVGKDSFYYSAPSCKTTLWGRGRCEEKNGFLFLYFENSSTKPTIPSQKEALLKKVIDTDSILKFRVAVRDTSLTPVQYATVVIENSKPSKSASVTDNNGIATIWLDPDFSPISVSVISVGYVFRSVKVEKDFDYDMTVFLTPEESVERVTHGEVFIYEIDEVSEDFISMRRKGWPDEFSKYKKRY